MLQQSPQSAIAPATSAGVPRRKTTCDSRRGSPRVWFRSWHVRGWSTRSHHFSCECRTLTTGGTGIHRGPQGKFFCGLAESRTEEHGLTRSDYPRYGELLAEVRSISGANRTSREVQVPKSLFR